MTPAAQATRQPRHSTLKKPYLRRRKRDWSQPLRRALQGAFLLLNLWIGVQFYLFVRQFESGGHWRGIERPPGVEGWLPIAGMMNAKYFLLTGEIPLLHPAAMFLFLTFVAMSLLLRKAFCGWLCPVGAVSEYLWKLGREILNRNYALPKWLDLPLRSLKYVLLGLFLYAVGGMTAEAIRAFLHSPYGVIADVKMLNFFRYLSVTAALVLAVLAVLSLLVQNFWCRYLCPYGALMGIAALVSPLRIRRDSNTCIDCGKCAKACPSRLPVDRLPQIRSAECIACMECVAACPAEGALGMSIPWRKKYLPAWGIAAAIGVLFAAVIGYAKASRHWDSPIPNVMYERLIPRAQEFGHP